MGYRLNRLTEPVFIAVSKLLLTEFGIHYRLESCGLILFTTEKHNQLHFCRIPVHIKMLIKFVIFLYWQFGSISIRKKALDVTSVPIGCDVFLQFDFKVP